MPQLAGRLRGAALYLQDLGPAIGASSSTAPQATHAAGKVLPDRPFNIPSLRAMDERTASRFSASPSMALVVMTSWVSACSVA